MKRVVYYLRLSKKDDYKGNKGFKESDSIENQRKILDFWIFDRNRENDTNEVYEKTNEYIDDGSSGMNFDREAFERMLQAAGSKLFDIILIKDLSRFGRNQQLVYQYAERIMNLNIELITATDNIRWSEDFSDLKTKIMILFNDEYSKSISDKIISSNNSNKRLGKFMGSFCTYGYKRDPADKHHLIIDEYAAETVRQVFKLYLDGNGKQKIARILNKQGIECPSRYKETIGLKYHNSHILDETRGWTYATVNRMLQNQMYIGNMVQGKQCSSMFHKKGSLPKEKWIISENTHEPIIDKETFAKVQTLLGKNTRSVDFGNVSLFSGFLKCDSCGKALVKTNWGENKKYVCSKYKTLGIENGCTRHTVDEKDLIEAVLSQLNKAAKSFKNELQKYSEIRKHTAVPENRIKPDYSRFIKDIEVEKKMQMRWARDIAEDIISEEDYIRFMKGSKDRIGKLEKQIENKKNEDGNERTETNYNNPILQKLINENLDTLTRSILATYVSKIIVYENQKIKIDFTFQNRTA